MNEMIKLEKLAKICTNKGAIILLKRQISELEEEIKCLQEELGECEEFEDRPIKTIECIAIRLCETINCNECPVTIYNYEKRTSFEKECQHIPCCYNLEKWIKDKAKENC